MYVLLAIIHVGANKKMRRIAPTNIYILFFKLQSNLECCLLKKRNYHSTKNGRMKFPNKDVLLNPSIMSVRPSSGLNDLYHVFGGWHLKCIS